MQMIQKCLAHQQVPLLACKRGPLLTVYEDAPHVKSSEVAVSKHAVRCPGNKRP